MNNSPKCTADVVTSGVMLRALGEQRAHGFGIKCFVMGKGDSEALGVVVLTPHLGPRCLTCKKLSTRVLLAHPKSCVAVASQKV